MHTINIPWPWPWPWYIHTYIQWICVYVCMHARIVHSTYAWHMQLHVHASKWQSLCIHNGFTQVPMPSLEHIHTYTFTVLTHACIHQCSHGCSHAHYTHTHACMHILRLLHILANLWVSIHLSIYKYMNEMLWIQCVLIQSEHASTYVYGASVYDVCLYDIFYATGSNAQDLILSHWTKVK